MKKNIKKNVSLLLLSGLLINSLSPISLLARDYCTKPKPTPKPENSCEFFKKVDYIVVGGGTAGLPCAWALTNDKETSVLVLEGGLDLTNDPIVLSPNLFAVVDTITYDPKYAATDVTTARTQRYIYVRGNSLGGSSTNNYYQSMRGTPEIYDEWAVITGNPEWSYKKLLKLFKSQEHYNPNGNIPNPQQRGLDGRLYISQADPLADEVTQAVARGFNVPWVSNGDYNDNYFDPMTNMAANQVGVYPNQLWLTDYCSTNTCGVRSFAGNSYLKGITEEQGATPAVKPIVDADNNGIHGRKLYVRTNTVVSRILFKGTKAVGVELIVSDGDNSKTMIARAKKGVILAAGAVMTPAILQRSGIGGAADLAPLGIDVLVDNPNVGYNAENQYGCDVVFRKTTPLNPALITPCWNDLGQGDGVRRCLTNIAPGAILPSIVASVIGVTGGNLFANYVNLVNFLLVTKSRGSVVLRSADPFTPPYVNLNMFSDATGTNPYNLSGPLPLNGNVNSQDLADAITLFILGLRSALEQPNATLDDLIYPPISHYPQDVLEAAVGGPLPAGTGAPAGNYSFLATDALLQPRVSNHFASTCRMAATADTGVVDGKLRVFGTKHLYVADLSITPVLTTGSTSYPAYFIGLQLAKFLGANLP